MSRLITYGCLLAFALLFVLGLIKEERIKNK